MVAFIKGLYPEGLDKVAALDIGTGNGVLALELQALGCSKVTGSDYSQASIDLAVAVEKQRCWASSIHWILDDILCTQLQAGYDLLQPPGPCSIWTRTEDGCCLRWDLLTDKGTLDAIGLMADARKTRAQYKRSVVALLKVGGLLVITSCNLSKDELIAELTCGSQDDADPAAPAVQAGCLVYVDHVQTYPVLKYGGQQGTHVCTVAFRRQG